MWRGSETQMQTLDACIEAGTQQQAVVWQRAGSRKLTHTFCASYCSSAGSMAAVTAARACDGSTSTSNPERVECINSEQCNRMQSPL